LNKGQTNRLLGYPADARLLIINADDFGMCHAVDEAVIRSLQKGVLRSTTLMMPCAWALHAIHFLTDHPEIPFGIHLTAISDWVDYRWGPLTPKEKVPSLINELGYFYTLNACLNFWHRSGWSSWKWNSGRKLKPCWEPGSTRLTWTGILCESVVEQIFLRSC
jgi:hypothetical protein